MNSSLIPSEKHPLEPFLPEGALILMLGSFPPKREKWSMEFFYPNFINDMWRIMGLIFFNDKEHFVIGKEKRFDRERCMQFAGTEGIAMYDTRLQSHCDHRTEGHGRADPDIRMHGTCSRRLHGIFVQRQTDEIMENAIFLTSLSPLIGKEGSFLPKDVHS